MSLLSIQHLRHEFGGLCALDDFNLLLEPGEIQGIIGPNGAGKTTVFNVITGIYRAVAGNILFNGEELVGKPAYRINRLGVARTFQNIRLFKSLTVFDNVRIAWFGRMRYSPVEALTHALRFSSGENQATESTWQLLEKFGIAAHAAELAGSLPYGLQRRVEMARAMMTKPRLLLIDEPAAGMNPQEIETLMTFIRWLRTEFSVTILLIEHQMRLVTGICERVTVLDFGATISAGTPEQVQTDPRVMEAYLGTVAAGTNP